MLFDIEKLTADDRFTPAMFRTPFNLENETVASDGAMIYVTEHSDKYPLLEELKVHRTKINNLKKLLKEIKDTTTWHPMPEITLPDKLLCHLCKGVGKIEVCPECNGEGELELESDFHYYQVTCKTCNVKNFVTSENGAFCHECMGNKHQYPYDSTIQIGGVSFAPRYIELVSEAEQYSIPDSKDRIFFRHKNDYGAIMRIRA